MFLEEQSEAAVGVGVGAQTEAFLDLPADRPYVPKKTGVDASTQMDPEEDDALFDFDTEARARRVQRMVHLHELGWDRGCFTYLLCLPEFGEALGIPGPLLLSRRYLDIHACMGSFWSRLRLPAARSPVLSGGADLGRACRQDPRPKPDGG